jgi:hypothetical protein
LTTCACGFRHRRFSTRSTRFSIRRCPCMQRIVLMIISLLDVGAAARQTGGGGG